MEKPKGYFIKKRINRPAKIVGLYYNTFFFFIIIAAVVFMACASRGIIGMGIGAAVCGGLYISLFYIQTKLGPKELAKKIKNYYSPIHHIKITKSFKRLK